jgi:uncharacterized protein YuzE
MFQKFRFDYDQDNDSLFVFNPNSKSKASIEVDELVIDFNSNKEVSAIEINNASTFIKAISNESELDFKEALSEIKECQVDIIPKSNFYVIKLMIILKTNQKINTSTLIPNITEPSPAIITAVSQ